MEIQVSQLDEFILPGAIRSDKVFALKNSRYHTRHTKFDIVHKLMNLKKNRFSKLIIRITRHSLVQDSILPVKVNHEKIT